MYIVTVTITLIRKSITNENVNHRNVQGVGVRRQLATWFESWLDAEYFKTLAIATTLLRETRKAIVPSI